MNAFLSNLSLRPSCYDCPAKSGKSGSDITIADFWGIEDVLPEFDDDKGISLVLSYSEKGGRWLAGLDCECIEVDYRSAQRMNPLISTSVSKPINRAFFFRQLIRKKNIRLALEDCSSDMFKKRVCRYLYRKIGI